MNLKQIALPLAISGFVMLSHTAAAGAIDDLNAKGFGWDVFDETTGFAVHTVDDPYSAFSGMAWANNWSTGKAPEYGTNYYSNGKLLYAPKMGSGSHPVFAGDLLVLNSAFRMMQASRYATFNDFVGMGGGKILVGSTGEGLKTTGDMHFRSTPESPFFISQNASFSSKTTFAVVSENELSSTPETVVSLMEEPAYVGSNRWWRFTIVVSAADATGFLGKLSIPDASLKLQVEDFGGEVEMTNRWVDVAFHPEMGYAITNTPGVLTWEADSIKIKALSLHKGTQIDMQQRSCVVGDLKVCNGELTMKASQSENEGGVLTVTNSITIEGKMRIVNNAPAWTSNSGEIKEIAIVRFGKDVDLSGVGLDDFELVTERKDSASNGVYQRLQLRRCEDGSSELCITRNAIVENVHVEQGADRSWTYGTESAEKFWSDHELEHSGVDYYLRFNGRAPQYWIETDTVFPAENFLFVNGEMFLKTDYVYFTNLVIATAKASLSAKKAGTVLDGCLGVYSDEDAGAVLAAEEGKPFIIQSEVYGSGNILFKGLGDKKLAGHNAEFFGKIGFTAGHPSRLFFGYGDSLGGAAKSFTYDAVSLTEGAALVPMRNVILDEPTRGLFVSGRGVVEVPAGTVMEVRNVVTYAGTLEKKGGGVLAFVRKPRFIDGLEETDPQEGMNVLSVEEGAVKAMSMEAFDGLALAFSGGAELRVPHMPDNVEFRDKGIMMTHWLSSITASGSALVVRFDSDADMVDEFEQGVATFASKAAADAFAGSISLRPRPSGYVYRKTVKENDGTFTVVASLNKIGFTISVR